jgi:DNA-binding NarL/FixJ family response regulator
VQRRRVNGEVGELLTLGQEIRKYEKEVLKNHHTIIVGLSGNQSFYNEAVDAGMDGFLLKPQAPSEILESVQN